MAKGYWLAQVDVRDPEPYKNYVAALQDVLRKFGGRYVVRAGETEVVEGKARSRIIVIEFSSYQVALDCYRSPRIRQGDPAAEAARRRRSDGHRGLWRRATAATVGAAGKCGEERLLDRPHRCD